MSDSPSSDGPPDAGAEIAKAAIGRDPGGFAGGVFKVGSKEGTAFVLQDSRGSLRRVLRVMAEDVDAGEADLFVELVTKADTQSRALLDIVIETKRTFGVGLAALIGNLLVAQSEKRKTPDLDWGWAVLEGCVKADAPERSAFEQLSQTAAAMIDVETRDAADAPLAAAQGFLWLAEWLEKKGQVREGLACAFSAANWLDRTQVADRSVADQLALRLARANGEPAALIACLMGPAVAAAREAESDPVARLRAHDAFERVVRACYQLGAVPGTIRPIANVFLQAHDFRTLSVAYGGIARVGSGPEELRHLLQWYFTPVWSGPSDAWRSDEVQDARRNLGAVHERARGELIGGVAGPLQADWNTWTIRLPTYQHAVPLNTDLWSEPRSEETVAATIHETAHVLCFTGIVGTAYRALRWGAYEAEVRVRFAHLRKLEELNIERLLGSPVPQALRQPDAAWLGHVERGAELERKAQVLRAVWSSWWEGLGLFAEGTNEPDVDDSVSPVTAVLRHLIDTQIQPQARWEETAEVVKTHFERLDAKFGDVVRRTAAPRLRTHLQHHAPVYLAGYLAVRRVVASWRRALPDRELTGPQAFRVLLHLTRFGDVAMIPHLALPLAEFRREATAAMLNWVRAIAQLAPAQLQPLLEPIGEEPHSYMWERGQLVRTTADDRERLTDVRYLRFAREAIRSSCGTFADLNRVPDASEHEQRMMKEIAGLFERAIDEVPVLPPAHFPRWLGGLSILPLAQAQASFWLVPAEQAVGCAIRTHAEVPHGDDWHGKFWQFPLKAAEFAELERRVRSGGPGRMTVIRFADLDITELGARQYLLWKYEDWTKVIPVGAFFGLPEAEQTLGDLVALRFAPASELAAFEELTGPAHPCSRRTLEWLGAYDWRHVGPRKDQDLSAWSRTVQETAAAVVAEDDTALRDEISLELYRWCFDDEAQARTWTHEGAADLIASGNFGRWVSFLAASARHPVPLRPDDVQLFGEFGVGPAEIGPHGWDVPPAVTPPASASP